MAELGPFEPAPRVAVAVSGGGDSMALAWLAHGWAPGRVLALVVDHGLRAESETEARLTCDRLAAIGIPAKLIVLKNLRGGAGLSERARAARYRVLDAACVEAGILHLLLGHQAADQAETVAMRRLAGSGPAGLAGMAALHETAELRRLRPLLGVAPGRLRTTLRAAGIDWVEDPSNTNPLYLRARLRAGHADAEGDGPVISQLAAEAARAGIRRSASERAIAATLGSRFSFYPEGYAVMAPGSVEPEALAAAIRTIGGAEHAPASAAVARLVENMRPATLGGVRVLQARNGWLLARELAAIAGPIFAENNMLWDRRFRLRLHRPLPAAVTIGAANGVKWPVRLPAAVARGVPALYRDGALFAVPDLGYPRSGFILLRGVASDGVVWGSVAFDPPLPAAPAAFVVRDGDAKPCSTPYVTLSV